MKILIAYAHTMTGEGTGAVGYINESKESRNLSDRVANLIKKTKHTVEVIGVDKSNSYLTVLSKIANKGNYDLVVQIHFNAFETTSKAMGNEVFHWYSNANMKNISTRVNQKLNTLYKSRGVKTNKDMNGRDAWLRLNKNPAILIETCFVDSKADTDTYKNNMDETARLIAEGLTGDTIGISVTPPKEPTDNGKLFRVIVGAYNKENAENMKKELIEKGYKDTYLMGV